MRKTQRENNVCGARGAKRAANESNVLEIHVGDFGAVQPGGRGRRKRGEDDEGEHFFFVS